MPFFFVKLQKHTKRIKKIITFAHFIHDSLNKKTIRNTSTN